MDAAVVERTSSVSGRTPPLKYKFKMLDELSSSPPEKDWLIKNVLALKETSAWIAPPGGMKSALIGELSFAVATRSDWHGHKAKATGAVVYFALERADLVGRRLRAHRARLSDEVETPPIAIVSATINLMKQDTILDVIASIRAVERETGQPVVMIVFDTFAKLIAAGGGDEDKAKDQGAVFAKQYEV